MSDPAPNDKPHTVVDGGDLDCGSGLLLMIRSAFEPLPPGALVEIRSREISVGEDLPAWCRVVGHELLSTTKAPNKYLHFLVRKKGSEPDAEFEKHLEKAKSYEWRLRAKWTEGMDARVFSRNHTIDVGQPASFNTEDKLPGSVELLLSSLASCLVSGLAWRLGQKHVAMANIEITLAAKPENILVFLGIDKDGDPGFSEIRGKVYVATQDDDVLDETISEIWQDTLARSPVARTLSRGTKLQFEFTRVR